MCERRFYLFEHKMDKSFQLVSEIKTHLPYKPQFDFSKIAKLIQNMPKTEREYYDIETTEWFVQCQKNAAKNEAEAGITEITENLQNPYIVTLSRFSS